MGFVYVISAGVLAHKIGVANNPQKRLSELQVGTPTTLELICKIEVADPREVEVHAHWMLREDHMRGEWFRVFAEHAKSTVEAAALRVRDFPHEAKAERGYFQLTRGGPLQPAHETDCLIIPTADAMSERRRNAELCRALLPKPRVYDKPYSSFRRR